MPQKGSSPWSTRTTSEGGTDSPVGDLVPVPDSAQPVINAGFIDEAGKWRVDAAGNDSAFIFQDPNQALGPGASIFIEPINTLNHNILILALLDSSGNAVNVDILMENSPTLEDQYNATEFLDTGVGGEIFKVNNYPPGGGQGVLEPLLQDTSENLANTWTFYKIHGVKGLVSRLRIRSNDGVNTGTISSAYLRIP